MKKYFLCFLIFNASFFYSQNIVTATNYFDKVSLRYANIRDYVASISVKIIDENDSVTTMKGKIIYLRPKKILINYTYPRGQKLVSDGNFLKIYMPSLRTILTQNIKGKGDVSSMASSKGLALLKSKYSIAYTKSGPGFVLLNGNSGPRVKKLILLRKNPKEGFKKLELSILENNFIRRIDGLTANSKRVIFEFTNISINRNISSKIFSEQMNSFPPNANEFLDFLH